MRADQHQTTGVADVGALGAADTVAKGQVEAHVPRPPALGVGGGGQVGGAIGLEGVLEEGAADTVAEERHGLGTVFRLDLLHLLGDMPQGLVPGDLGPLLLPSLLSSHQRRPQSVGVVVGAQATGAAGAETATAQRVLGVPLDLPQLAALGVGDRPAAPEADVAVGRHGVDIGIVPGPGHDLAHGRWQSTAGGRKPGGTGGDLQKASSRQDRHFWVSSTGPGSPTPARSRVLLQPPCRAKKPWEWCTKAPAVFQ